MLNGDVHFDPILSAYTNRDPTSRVGKMKWLNRNTDFKRSNINLVLRSQKQKFATTDEKPNVLIDDYKKNIREWESQGGIGILHTNVVKTISNLKSADGLVVGSAVCNEITRSLLNGQNPVTNVSNIVRKLRNKIL